MFLCSDYNKTSSLNESHHKACWWLWAKILLAKNREVMNWWHDWTSLASFTRDGSIGITQQTWFTKTWFEPKVERGRKCYSVIWKLSEYETSVSAWGNTLNLNVASLWVCYIENNCSQFEGLLSGCQSLDNRSVLSTSVPATKESAGNSLMYSMAHITVFDTGDWCFL